MMKKAFTLIELIFVIIVIGILAATILPNTKQNPLETAAVQLVSHLRYTQHLAMIDDPYEDKYDEWFHNRWRLKFYKGDRSNQKWSYSIFSEADSRNNARLSSLAKNPLNIDQYMSGGHNIVGSKDEKKKLDIREKEFIGMKTLNLGESYGISKISLKDGCSRTTYLSFDHFGRPLKLNPNDLTNSYKKDSKNVLISKVCSIILESDDNKIKIEMAPETGYMKIIF